jgi:hypothetical protein
MEKAYSGCQKNVPIAERFFCYHTDTALLFSGVFVSTPTRIAGGLDLTAIGGKRQEREVSLSLRVEPGAKHPVWKTQSKQKG